MTNTQLNGLIALVALLISWTPLKLWADEAAIDLGLSQKVYALSYLNKIRYPPDFKHFALANPDAPKGGTLRLGAEGAFDSLNFFVIKGNTPKGLGWDWIHQRLSYSAPDDDGWTYYPLVAKDYEIADDRSWMIINLRPEARWNDGAPITAEDVQFSFDVLRSKAAGPAFAEQTADVSEVRVLSPHRILFRFRSNKNRELPIVLGSMHILPKHYYGDDKVPFKNANLVPPLSSGPYRIVEVDPGRRIVLERVKNHWSENLPVQKGLYNFDRIIIDYYFDQAVVFEAFKRGIIDMFWEDRAIRWLQEYDFPAAREDRVRKLEVAKPARAQGTEGIVFNLRQPLFKRYEVRRAFTILFDFERYNRDYLVGQATPARSYFAGSFEQQATGLPSPDELRLLEPYRHLLPPEVFTAEYQVPKGNTRDRIRRALDLFKEAGYFVETSPESPYRMKVIDPDTRRPVRLEFLSRRRSEERLFLFYANMLNRAGIEASVRTVDSSQFTKRIEYRDFDAYLGGAFGYESPGNEQLNLLGSAGASEPGSWNTPGVAHPAIDGLVRKIIEAQTRSEVVTVSRALDRVMMWGQFYGPQWTFDRSYFAYWNRFGYMESQERPGTSAVISWWEKSPIAEASMQP